MSRGRLTVAALVLGLVAGGARAGSPRLVLERGWAPIVTSLGGGDVDRAIDNARVLARVADAVVNRLHVDPPTQAFLDGTWATLEDFDLESFHALLPEADGDWRRLRVVGTVTNGSYEVRRAAPGNAFEVRPGGPRRGLGEASAVVAARRAGGSSDGDATWLLQARAGLVVGPFDWPAVTRALERGARMLTEPAVSDDRRPAPDTLARIAAMHPHLDATDLELIGVLWESFPRLGDVLHGLGRTEDVVAGPIPGRPGVVKLRLGWRARPELVSETYPDLADFLADLDELVKADLRWVDGAGRVWVRTRFDSEELLGSLEVAVRDGHAVPLNGTGEPAELPTALDARGTLDFDVLGVRAHLDDVRMSWRLQQRDDGAVLSGAFTHEPTIAVDGRALGVLPTWAIDAVIPSNLAQLIGDFLHVACAGNDGRGVRITAKLVRTSPEHDAVLQLDGQLEALDNALVQIGVAIVNERLMPDDDVNAELNALASRVHAASVSDLERFAKLAR